MGKMERSNTNATGANRFIPRDLYPVLLVPLILGLIMTVIILRLISPDSPAAYAESIIPEAIPFNAPTGGGPARVVDPAEILPPNKALAMGSLETTSSLVGWWAFNYGSGIVAKDSSGNGLDGALHGDLDEDPEDQEYPQWSAGRIDGALHFDCPDVTDKDGACEKEQDVLVSHDDSLNFDNDTGYTLSVWFKYDTTFDADLVRKGSTNTSDPKNWYKLEVETDTQTLHGLVQTVECPDESGPDSGKNVTADFATDDGLWHHAAMVRDVAGVDGYSPGLRLYIDGVLHDETGNPEGCIDNTANLGIGNKDTGDDDWLNGDLDDVRIYSVALTDDDIKRLAFGPLVAHWKFDETIGNTVTLQGDTTQVSGGKVAQALEFDGSGDYADLSSSTEIPIGDEVYSIAAWFNVDSMGSQGIVGWGNFGAGNQNQVNALRLSSDGFRHY